MKDKIALISKDILLKSYLPVYGNTYYKTPNIDELAQKGTVFLKHYTAAPSTAMSFTAMFTGLYAFETDRQKYVEVSEFGGDTLFDKLFDRGYACHIVWDKSYMRLAHKYSKCYGAHSKIHNTDFLTRKQPPHINGRHDDMSFDPAAEKDCLAKFEELTKQICDSSPKVFYWAHLPHALMGRNAYGSDIDMLDRMVGIIRKYFDDGAIYITADHGHMNGRHGKYGYGFDVNQNAIEIPLITARIENRATVDFPTSNVQLMEIILDQSLQKRDVLYSETAYYMQPHRKIAVIRGKYKYIYEKKTGREFLYDVEWDPEENVNLLATEIYDVDRRRKYSATQRFFYPYWTDVLKEYECLKAQKDSIWKDPPFLVDIKERFIQWLKILYTRLQR